jgi:exodeoxyribonuclease-3
MLSPEAADRLRDAGVDKDYRGREKASDHAPTWIDLT